MKRAVAATIVALALCISPAVAFAGSITFHVDIATTALINNAAGPFSLDFQLNNGSGIASNTATIYNFTYGGGSAVSPANTFGGASGDIGSVVNLVDSSAFNELFQQFNPGATLGFDVLLSTNVDAPVPDAFAFAILDGNLFNLPTNGFADTLVFVNLNSNGLGVGDVQAFRTIGNIALQVTVQPVPEPGTLVLLIAGAATGLRRLRRP